MQIIIKGGIDEIIKTKFESKEVAEDFLKKIKETEKCKDVYEYYSKTEINIFDFFRK